MKGNVAIGAWIEIQIPESPRLAFLHAAHVLQEEIGSRVDLRCRIVQGFSESPPLVDRPTVIFILATLETLSDEIQNQIDPPVKLLPFPDYAEHVCVRVSEGDGIPKIFAVCGEDRALLFGVGFLMRCFRFDEEGLAWEVTSEDFQPLIPMRGCFFSEKRTDLLSLSGDRTTDWIKNHSLWGNNVLGCDPVLIASGLREILPLYSLSLLTRIVDFSSLSENDASNYRWITQNDFASSWQDGFMKIQQNIERHGVDGSLSEIWMECNGWKDEDIHEFFDRMMSENRSFIKAVVSGLDESSWDFVKRDIPLTMQLVSMNPFDVSMIRSPMTLARRFFDYAPLTYGALGISSMNFDEIARFSWSLLSWSPQPALEKMIELYGHWYFGNSAAGIVREVFFSENPHRVQIARWMNKIESSIPPRMYAISKQRVEMLKQIIL